MALADQNNMKKIFTQNLKFSKDHMETIDVLFVELLAQLFAITKKSYKKIYTLVQRDS